MASSTRRFVSKLAGSESINQVFLASDKQLRPNRSGNYYLQVELSDRSGSISARLWNASDDDYRSFENGDYVHVDGSTQIFQGAIQLIANRIRRADRSEVDESDFVILSDPAIDQMARRLAEILRDIKNPHLRNLAECFLIDDDLMRKFAAAPAGIKHHHAYRGGLLEHVLNLLEVILLIHPRFSQVDRDLLLMGAFLHDVGKIDELLYDRELAYSDTGQLLGHIVIAVSILDRKIRETEQFAGEPIPAELIDRLKHMIVSHHGQYDFGSPRLPMTVEAIALHYLDNLDAKVHQFQHLLDTDANLDSSWTQYQHNLGRKLFKGRAP